MDQAISYLRENLLEWYCQYQRHLPWRSKKGQTPNPYYVWLSEIMLQQTTVPTVIPYFEKFIERWPHLKDLAEAPLDEILVQWQGLGYYARARNLYRAAQTVMAQYQGVFPKDPQLLETLPGIGSYTAGAIASIAFGYPIVPIDGNIIRVFSRLKAIEEPLPKSISKIKEVSQEFASEEHPGDFAQALMDLGSAICTPKNPQCAICPWNRTCEALRLNRVEDFPHKADKIIKSKRFAVAFFLLSDCGSVYLQKRPEKGLLGGMMEVPTTTWRSDEPWDWLTASAWAPVDASWKMLEKPVRHVFTHFNFEVQVTVAQIQQKEGSGIWAPLHNLGAYALPTVMKKIIAQGTHYFKG